jgi:hypothetical protein
VKQEATTGINVDAVNEFGVRMFRELPLNYLPHRVLSTPQVSPEGLHFNKLFDNNNSSDEMMMMRRRSSTKSKREQLNKSSNTMSDRLGGDDDDDEEEEEEEEDDEDDHPLRAKSRLQFEITETGMIHGFAFWFHQTLYQQEDETVVVELNTGPEVSRSNLLSHWRQAAVSLKSPLKVVIGQKINVNVIFGIGVNAGVDISML